MKINDDIKTLSNIFKTNHIPFYIVGGAVRDDILGLNINDYDFAVGTTPEVLLEIFKDYKKDIYHINLGSLKVHIGSSLLELSCLRKESGKKDERFPSKVEFTTDLLLDASRRDFTINAVYYDLDKGYIDPLNGINDIKNHLIKFIGNPMIRILEDPLRIIRAIRFELLLDFNIDADTKNIMINNLPLLKDIGTLKYDELYKILKNNKNLGLLKEYKGLNNCFDIDLDLILNSDDPLDTFLLNIPDNVFANIHMSSDIRKRYKKLRN